MDTKTLDMDELFNYYGSDKTKNGYANVYHALFKNLKKKEINFLEIGIGTMMQNAPSSMVGWALPGYKPGGSLRAWRDYFINGKIYGADIQLDTQFKEERIETFLCNSTIKTEVEKTFGDNRTGMKFDIIIDDGSHLDEHQLKTIINLFPRVNPGGYYIIEDVVPNSRILTSFMDTIKQVCGDALIFVNEIKNLVIVSKR